MCLDGLRPDSRPTDPSHTYERPPLRPPKALGHATTAVVVAGMLSLTGVACGPSGSGEAARAGTTPVRAETTVPPTTVDAVATEAAEKAEITRRYQEWYRLIRSLKETDNNWKDPRLAEYAEEPVLSEIRATLKQREALGETSIRVRDSLAHGTVTAITISGIDATLAICEVNDAQLISADGAVLDDQVVTYMGKSRWSRQSGAWKFAEGLSSQELQGVHSCD